MSTLDLSVSPIALSIGNESMVLQLGAAIGAGGASFSFISITEDTAIDSALNGARYDNTGAVAAVVATLPPAVFGLSYGLRVSAAYDFGVTPDTGDTIALDDLVIDDTQTLQCALIGAVVDLECHSTGTWIVTNIRREWETV